MIEMIIAILFCGASVLIVAILSVALIQRFTKN